jgi:hypothetical protein
MSASRPKATESLRSSEMTLSAITGREQSQQINLLFDHLVGAGEERRRTRTLGSSTARLGVTQNDLGNLKIVAHSSLPETFDDAIAILHIAILTHLPLTL